MRIVQLVISCVVIAVVAFAPLLEVMGASAVYAQDNHEEFERYYYAGEDAYYAGNYKIALDLWIQASKLISDDPDIYAAIGECYMQLGKFEKAFELYSKTLAMDPDNDVAMGLMGLTFERIGKYDEAKKWYSESIRITKEKGKTISSKTKDNFDRIMAH